MQALCAVTDTQVAERAAHAFLYVLRLSPGRTIPLLVTLIANEVRKTGEYEALSLWSRCGGTHPLDLCGAARPGIIQGSTLFRGNDIASQLLSAYCQMIGRKYLMKVIRPLVEKVVNLYAQNKSMEVHPCEKRPRRAGVHLTRHTQIDPARLSPGEDIEEKTQTLTEFCNMFLNAVTGSLKHCPRYGAGSRVSGNVASPS